MDESQKKNSERSTKAKFVRPYECSLCHEPKFDLIPSGDRLICIDCARGNTGGSEYHPWYREYTPTEKIQEIAEKIHEEE
jgi:hypothetical protein